MKNNQDFFGYNTVFWMGVVEDRQDPVKLARVRVRVMGWHSQDKDELPTAELPWAQIMHPSTSSVTGGVGIDGTGLRENDWVIGIFLDGELARQPLVLGSLAGIETDTEKPSTNPLSAHDEDNISPLIALKDDARSLAVPTAIEDATWDEPASTYAALYPNNHVMFTESGHVMEYDDTPEAERIHQYHKSGTFYEIDTTGNKVTRIVADQYEIVAGNNYVHVMGDVNLTIDSNCTTYIKGNWDVKVDGNVTQTIGGTLTESVTGNVIETYSANQTLNVVGDVTEQVDGNQIVTIVGDVSETYGGNQTTAASGNVDIDASNVYIN